MRTFLVAGFAMMAAMAAQASYLYWQVDTSSSEVGQSLAQALVDYNTKWDPQGKQADVTLGDISGARLVRVDKTTSGSTPVVLDSMPTADFNPNIKHGVEIDASFIDSANYAYYIEIVANSAQPYSLVAVSQQLTYAQLATQGAVYENSELKTPSLVAWTGGSFSAAPEPTSGLLLMIGVGLLGLKRKRA